MVCASLATPGTEACDAVGGAFRLQWREWPSSEYWTSSVVRAEVALRIALTSFGSKVPTSSEQSIRTQRVNSLQTARREGLRIDSVNLAEGGRWPSWRGPAKESLRQIE